MTQIPIFYCGKVNSQGGSKQSLLNTLLLLNKNKLKFKILVGNEGWFTDELTRNGIKYLLIKEPSRFHEINSKSTKKEVIKNIFLSVPLIIINWFKILVKNKNIKKNIVLNEPRDLICFLPYIFSKNKITLWLRSEYPGRLTKNLLKRANKVISVSDKTKKHMSIYNQKKIEVIPNFLQNPLHSKIRSNKNHRIILAGSIQLIKGQEDAIKSLALLPENYSLQIVGRVVDQKYYNNLLLLTRKYNLEKRVFFIKSQFDFLNYLNENADLVIMPSKTESFGRVAMEAMSLGIPVVAYNVGGLPEVVVNKITGLLVDYNDIDRLATSILEIMNNEKLYKQMSEESLNVFNNRFSEKAVLKKLKKNLY